MVEHFGGPSGGADAVPEVEYQRHLLCYEAKLHAESELAKQPAKNAPPSPAAGDTTVTNTTRRKRAPNIPAE